RRTRRGGGMMSIELLEPRRCLGILLAAAAMLATSTVAAHHGDAGRYEDGMTTITGPVVEFNLVNPHSLIVIDVESGGMVERWQIETSSPNNLRRQNFTPDTVKLGDTITVSGRRRKNGEPYLTLTGGAIVKDAAGNEIYH